jgi:hypothetical protein
LLPRSVSIPVDAHLPVIETEDPPYNIRFFPPSPAALTIDPTRVAATTPVLDHVQDIRPAENIAPNPFILFDGKPTISANLIQIDFIKPEFDRRASVPGQAGADDPPREYVFSIANGFLRRLRSAAAANWLSNVNPTSAPWRIRFLDDRGDELPVDPRLARGKGAIGFSTHLLGIPPQIWERVAELPLRYIPPTWDTLLLDADLLMPQVGPALVMAATAIETLAAAVLSHLASIGTASPALWQWINNRDWIKTPSVEEQCDTLLDALGGRSLKSNATLWQAFKNLKTVRNSFVHEGRPLLGGAEISESDARIMLTKAQEIVQFLEAFLPLDQRRATVRGVFNWSIQQQLIGTPTS